MTSITAARQKILSRLRKATTGTPLEYSDSLSSLLGCNLFIKREDLAGAGFGFSGTKLRKLYHIAYDALEKGATCFIVTGNVQSNHARHTAYLAGLLGLKCFCVLQNDTPEYVDADHMADGNIYLSKLYGAQISIVPDTQTAVAELTAKLRAAGECPYIVTRGGSNSVGDLGYVECAQELLKAACVERIYVCSGSGGTHAGLAYGCADTTVDVIGVSNKRSATAQREVVSNCLDNLASIKNHRVQCDLLVDARFADEPKYGHITSKVIETLTLFQEHAGLLLDPTYSVKTALALLADAPSLRGKNVVFINGGQPVSLFAYRPHVEAIAQL